MPRTVPYTVKTNALKKKRVVVIIRKIILPLISLLSKLNVTIYHELSVGHKASISSLSLSIICTVVTFQHVEKVFPDWCFSCSNTIPETLCKGTTRLHCRNDICVYIIASTF